MNNNIYLFIYLMNILCQIDFIYCIVNFIVLLKCVNNTDLYCYDRTINYMKVQKNKNTIILTRKIT